MAELHTLPPIEAAPPSPDLPGQIARLQRHLQRRKDALARLEKTLAQTRQKLRKTAELYELARVALAIALPLARQDRPTEVAAVLEETISAILYGSPEARTRIFAAARKRDEALLTLRAKVTELHGALSRAKRTIRGWRSHGWTQTEEAQGWALYQSSPEMQEINRALGE